jgi:CheY-like chemotaxis protein
MVKQAVAELGGEIELESERGAGTLFRVTLPGVRRASTRPTSKRSSGVFYAEPIEQRVLVVDDDAGLREMIATALSMRGAEVVCVADAKGALEQPGPFALAIIDLLLPGMRGDELLARLRALGVTHTGMLVTGTEPPLELADGGTPDAVLRKPFELEDLFQRLSELLGKRPESSSVAG